VVRIGRLSWEVGELAAAYRKTLWDAMEGGG
jgi:hypothetical protein